MKSLCKKDESTGRYKIPKNIHRLVPAPNRGNQRSGEPVKTCMIFLLLHLILTSYVPYQFENLFLSLQHAAAEMEIRSGQIHDGRSTRFSGLLQHALVKPFVSNRTRDDSLFAILPVMKCSLLLQPTDCAPTMKQLIAVNAPFDLYGVEQEAIAGALQHGRGGLSYSKYIGVPTNFKQLVAYCKRCARVFM